ncbi:hypothetical protein P389DRAFT_197871 [Cystobasidium minutum MCA 4210]|uniref:uncharacterized protein n=1 Tax=Cystobasidium minutum MCA 4210 TaxID=1397322 RepID=UPI0034CD40F8|eukprot:jgi/Rhomi1/197871/gm1.6085_g
MASADTASPSPAPPAAAANGSATINAKDAFEGIILPPPDIKSIVDKTAAFIAKNPNPAAFEEKIRAREKTDSRFGFLNGTDAYHAYYQNRVKAFREGTGGSTPVGAGGAGAGAGTDAVSAATKALAGAAGEMVDEGRPTVPEPRPFDFISTEKPHMAAVDHDILKLTALFTARLGRGFTNDLQAREAGNYQFDFLRPSHSLFGYFNRLVEQYTKILMAPKETLAMLDRQAGYTQDFDPLLHTDEKRRAIARREINKEIENRVEWQKYANARKQAEDTAAEEERVAFAQIDWQDFIVVTTVEFTEQDELLDLPPPMSKSEVENMTMAQKKMAAMIMEGKSVPEAAVDSGAVSQEAEEAEMQMSDDEADQLVKKVDGATAAQQEARAAAVPANVKIRKDYVPKAQRPKKVATSTCRICGQQIPENEMEEHVRIELLDPRWKERQMAADAKRTAANMVAAGTDVSASLRQIASKRTDIFATTQEEEARRRKAEEEEALRKRERETNVWDGYTSSALSTAERFQSGANLDQQIAALHKAKGLTVVESNIGPKKSDAPPAAPAEAAASGPFLNAPGTFSGATLSAAPNPQAQAAPQPAQQQQQQPQQQHQQPQYNAYQQYGAYPPQGYPQQGYYDPNQQAYLQQQQQYQQQQQQYATGQARPADQNNDPNKRQKQ